MDTNGWNEYRELFKHLIGKIDSIDEKLERALIQVSKLEERNKLMSALYGALGGGIAVLSLLAIKFLG